MTDHLHFDRVLVGFDGKDRSLPAVRAALEIHRALGSHLDIVYVSDIRDPFHPPEQKDPVARLWEEEERAAREHARERLGALLEEARLDDVTVDDVLSFYVGTPPQVLVERAQGDTSDVVVIGPHEKRGRLDFGSTARAIMHNAECNVWVQPGPFRPVRKILVPTDLSEHSLRAVQTALRLARGLDAEITLLHAYTPPTFSYSSVAMDADAATFAEVIDADRDSDREAFERMQEQIDPDGVKVTPLWLEGYPEDVIVDQGASHDLIALGTHGRTGLAAALLGNVAYRVLRHSETPVLAVRMPRRRWLHGSE